jgi:SnoaL-like domain
MGEVDSIELASLRPAAQAASSAGLRARRRLSSPPVSDQETRAKLDRHWSTAGDRDQEAAHEIYHEDCVVEWPQSGERVRGRANLRALRTAYPARLEFSVRRILGGGDLWITEYSISYDGQPVHVVSIMEFRDGLVARETHYFADPFEAPEWRARWVEPM